MPIVDPFPSVEVMLVAMMAPLFPDYRFVVTLPKDVVKPTCRFTRTSGAARDIRVDRPIVDADVYASDKNVSDQVAREVQAALLSLRGAMTLNGVVQAVNVIVGPRWLPDPNPNLERSSASYEVRVHL
jgi:hypothetical protein